MMFYLICFDIADDRVRYRVVKELLNNGVRVQKSVFECGNLTEERFLKLKNRIEALIDHGEDTVRYYQLCRGCLFRFESSGTGDLPEQNDFKVV